MLDSARALAGIAIGLSPIGTVPPARAQDQRGSAPLLIGGVNSVETQMADNLHGDLISKNPIISNLITNDMTAAYP